MRKKKVVKEKLLCPLCKSSNIEDDSIWERGDESENKGSRFLLKELYFCKDCGILFKDVRE